MGKIYKNGIEYGGGGGDSAGHIILDNDGNAMTEEPNLQFKGLNVTDNSTDEVTEVESVGLNQDSMDDVLNASIPGNQVASNGLVYSTEEQVVGRWINGKPLYQKTVAVNVTTTNAWNTAPHGVSNIDKIVSIDSALNTNVNETWAATGYRDNGTYNHIVVNTNTVIGIYVSGNADFKNQTDYVTIRYTKTTD